MALRLGKTLAELEQTLTAREFYYWVAFDQINPIGDERNDIHSAQVASAIYQSQGAKIKLTDCLLNFNSNQTEPNESIDIAVAMANLLGKHHGKQQNPEVGE